MQSRPSGIRPVFLRWLIGGLMFCALPVVADESDEIKLKCVQRGTVLKTSTIADINEFDAASYGVTLSKSMPGPVGNTTVYIFTPGPVMCVVVHE